jgi:uncharacterized membrane protein
MTTSEPVRRYVTTERRTRPLMAGAGLIAVGLIVLAIGAAILWGSQTVQVLGADGRAKLGAPLRFDADAREYSLVLLPNPLAPSDQDRALIRTDCSVTTSDGATRQLDVAHRAIRLETSLGRELTSFDAPAGATTARCAFSDSEPTTGYVYAVAPRHAKLVIGGLALFVVGVVLTLIGVALVVVGFRGRAVMHRVP